MTYAERVRGVSDVHNRLRLQGRPKNTNGRGGNEDELTFATPLADSRRKSVCSSLALCLAWSLAACGVADSSLDAFTPRVDKR